MNIRLGYKIQFLCFLLTLALGGPVEAQRSDTSISFQARLNGQNGQLLPNGNYNLSFRFWDGPAPAGNAVSTNVLVTNVLVTNGVAATAIPVDPSWFNGQPRYLGISVNGGAELLPRVLVTAVPYSVSTRGLTVDDSGRVGIGATSPPRSGPVIKYPRPANRVVIGNTTEDINRVPINNEALVIGTTNGADATTVGILFDMFSRADSGITVEKDGDSNIENTIMHFYVGNEGVPTAINAMTINPQGHVGIGTPERGEIYHRLVVGTTPGGANYVPQSEEAISVGTTNTAAGYEAGIYFDSHQANGAGILLDKLNDGGNMNHRLDFYVTYDGSPYARNCMSIVGSSGDIGIGTTDPQAKLDVTGTTRTQVLQITGGSDLAEHINVAEPSRKSDLKIEPGMVVSIDPTGNRKFKLSDKPYDRRRVGIISGGNGVKPGLMLQDDGNPAVSGNVPIALSGQVWCRADASYSAIRPGDLLTTSSTPGYAMKVTDFNKARFAVLGQALTGLKKGRGWVEVLVRYQ